MVRTMNDEIPPITFDKSMKEKILELFGKSVNEEGLIVEKENRDNLVLSPEDGKPVHIDEFGGIIKGSEIFIRNDVVSLMRVAKDKK